MSSTLELAIVGSGPSGCYLAQAIHRALPDAAITIFDRLPVPFGLIRYGVAADHQHTKAITRQFDRLFAEPQVRFAGNIELGTDLSLNELRQAFDVVVLATGLLADRELDVPGASLAGVYGAGSLTRLLNTHPSQQEEFPELGSEVVIIGGGNVAIDLLRFLVKDDTEYDGSDISEAALQRYLRDPAVNITLLNRSLVAQAKSDPQMLAELVKLRGGSYEIPGLAHMQPSTEDRVAQARYAALQALSERPIAPGAHVTLRFGAVPISVLGEDRVSGVEFTVDGRIERVPASAVLLATGFHAGADPLAELIAVPAESGRIAPGLYRTGWAKRGPRGAIPENRACAKSVADEILEDLRARGNDTKSGGYAALPESLRASAVSFAHWQRIDAHERESASANRSRNKISDVSEMLRISRDKA